MARKMKHPRRSAPQATDAEILTQIPAAIRREERERAVGLRATTATYEATRERIVVELTNGIAFAFPVQLVPGLAQASPAQRAALELSPSGDGILWERLNTDVSVPGLIRALVGRDASVLESLRGQLDALYAGMQTPEADAAADRGFNATPQEMGRAAVEAARAVRRSTT